MIIRPTIKINLNTYARERGYRSFLRMLGDADSLGVCARDKTIKRVVEAYDHYKSFDLEDTGEGASEAMDALAKAIKDLVVEELEGILPEVFED